MNWTVFGILELTLMGAAIVVLAYLRFFKPEKHVRLKEWQAGNRRLLKNAGISAVRKLSRKPQSENQSGIERE